MKTAQLAPLIKRHRVLKAEFQRVYDVYRAADLFTVKTLLVDIGSGQLGMWYATTMMDRDLAKDITPGLRTKLLRDMVRQLYGQLNRNARLDNQPWPQWA